MNGAGKRALVTGASSGIGLELARLLAADGYALTLVARRGSTLELIAAELGDAQVVAADLGVPGAVEQVVAAAPAVDVLVNNAGVGDFGPFAATDPNKTATMLQLNIAALTELTRAYLPGMLERGHGQVLNVASTAAFQPGPLMAVYYATKAYVLSFSEAVAEEVRGSGVTVTALCPGPTESGFQGRRSARIEGFVISTRPPAVPDRWPGQVDGVANKISAASSLPPAAG